VTYSDDDLLRAIRASGLEGAIQYWDTTFRTRAGLNEALLQLIDASRVRAVTYGSGPDREIVRLTDIPPTPGSPGDEVPPAEPAARSVTPSSTTSPDDRHVFVVHGRDDALRSSIFAFLRALDLHPMEWTELTQQASAGAPYIGDLLDLGFAQAQAVVVLFTPDEVVRLAPRLAGSGDEDGLQARPNVLFEAGLAMGRRPDRTVLVTVGDVREFSDIAGRHAVRLDDTSEQRVALRQDLAQRLQAAGCRVSLRGTDWHSAGRFVVDP
jgi:predicted nucleotide-binding protein